MRCLPILALVLLLGLVPGGAARAASLYVTIDDLRNAEGHVIISLYDNAGDWLKEDRAIQTATVPARRGRVTTVFNNLKPGLYAVVTLHDTNDDGRMDYTFLGLPKKGYAFSRNVRPFLSAPAFDRADVALGPAGGAIVIHMGYP